MPPKSVAVLGGGITGLSTAFHLSRRHPGTRIVLLEKANRLGGWMNSKRVYVHDRDDRTGRTQDAEVLVEQGPRTLRPGSEALMELVNLLGLDRSLILTPKSSPAAKNRFLHIPGTAGLTPLPSSLITLLNSPRVAQILLPSVLRELFKGRNTLQVEDESVEGFLCRRFGEDFARVFGSALVHGIYATDARLLSVRSAFPSLWDAEQRGNGSVIRGFLARKQSSPKPNSESFEVGDVPNRLAAASVFSFRDGMNSLPKALEVDLRSRQNVALMTGVRIQNIRKASDGFEITLHTGEALTASHVVSALPLAALSNILPPNSLPHLVVEPTSTVTVVNIIFPPTKRPIHPPGFGYLIPRPRNGYPQSLQDSIDKNISSFLGTVFDSCALSEQDIGDAGFTKLTVMLGGPYGSACTSADPSIVLSQLQRHLYPNSDNKLPDPVFYEVHEQRDCIPMPTVGHLQRVEEIRFALKNGPWGGHLEVVGAGVTGVSVPDCVSAGRNAGRDW